MLKYFSEEIKGHFFIMDEELFKGENPENPEQNDTEELYDSFEVSVSPEPFFTPVAACEVILPELSDEQIKKEDTQKTYRSKLALALMGLVFSLFYGAGFVFSLIGFITSVNLIKKTKSTTVRWALVLSIIGLFINVAVFIMLSLYARSAPPFPAEEPVPGI